MIFRDAADITQTLDLLADDIRSLGPLTKDEAENIGSSIIGLRNAWAFALEKKEVA